MRASSSSLVICRPSGARKPAAGLPVPDQAVPDDLDVVVRAELHQGVGGPKGPAVLDRMDSDGLHAVFGGDDVEGLLDEIQFGCTVATGMSPAIPMRKWPAQASLRWTGFAPPSIRPRLAAGSPAGGGAGGSARRPGKPTARPRRPCWPMTFPCDRSYRGAYLVFNFKTVTEYGGNSRRKSALRSIAFSARGTTSRSFEGIRLLRVVGRQADRFAFGFDLRRITDGNMDSLRRSGLVHDLQINGPACLRVRVKDLPDLPRRGRAAAK